MLSNKIQKAKHDEIWKDRQAKIKALSPPPEILSRHPTRLKELFDMKTDDISAFQTNSNTYNQISMS